MRRRAFTSNRTAAFCMFAGEWKGELVLCHIASRADSVRQSIAKLFPPRADSVKSGWREARKEGWRVVSVIVQERKAWLQRERM